MKKIIAFLLAMIMVISLVACGTEKPVETKPQETQGGTNKPAETQPAATEPAAEPVTIRVASYRSEDEAIYQEMIKMFNEKYPHITVELDLNPDQTSYYQNIQADLIEGTAADVFDMHSNVDFVTYSQEGILMPQDDLAYMANYQEGAKAISSVDGVNYGFINAYNMIAILYNKAIFAKEGLSEPANFDEFVALCKTLREKGYGGVAYPGGAVAYNWLINAITNICAGSDGYKDLIEGMDSGKYTDITVIPGVADALKTAQAFRDNNVFYDAAEATALDQCLSLFAQEMAPMMMMGTWTFGTRDTDFPGLDVGVFAIPTLSNNGEHYGEAAQITVINAATENVEAAKLWVEFKASVEGSSYYCSNAKMISTIEGVGLDYEGGDVLAAAAANGINLLPTYTRNNKDYWNSNWKELQKGLVFGELEYETAIAEYTKFLSELGLAKLG